MPFDTQELALKHATNRGVYASCMDYQTIPKKEETELEENSENNHELKYQPYAVIGAEDGQAHSFTVNDKYEKRKNN
jgi:hypothetical protein